MRPGVDIVSSSLPPPRSAPTDTGVLFAVGANTGTGPTNKATLITSLAQYQTVFGQRSDGPELYDAIDAFFREGGGKAWVVIGATLTAATAATMLALFDPSLGPGQVVAPGGTDSATHTALLAHAAAANRIALCSAPVGSTKAQLLTLAGAQRSTGNGRFGALFAPGAVLPGVAPGTTRTIGMAPVAAGILSRNDRLSMNPNEAAAGVNGQAIYAIDLGQPVGTFSEQDYSDLNLGGVNMARLIYGGVRLYGDVTFVDRTVDATWLQLSWARLNMAITADADQIGEGYVFSQIDGRGHTIAAFGADLRAMLLTYWQDGALYGETVDDAFMVDVGNQVNTDQTIANGELHAVLRVKMSPAAEWVQITIVKVATTEALAA